jgi:NADH-quinone oxidoreductase subunit M
LDKVKLELETAIKKLSELISADEQVSGLITAGYIIWAVRRSIHGEISPVVEKATFDMSMPERVGLSIFAFLIIFFGIYPQPIFDLANSAFRFLGGM